MCRTCLILILAVLSIPLLSAALAAQSDSSGIIFTGCPPYVEGGHCDSMYYQVVGVDLSTGMQCPEMKYILVSGPGTINQKTGLWEFHPEREQLPSYYQDEVEIAAYKGHDTTSADENCRFWVTVTDQPPVVIGYHGGFFEILPNDTVVVPLEVSDPDWCDHPKIDSVVISPQPTGFFAYDTVSQTMTFIPDSADSAKAFEAVVSVSSGTGVRSFHYYFNVFWPPPTYSVRIGYQRDVIQGQFHEVPITLEKFDLTQGLGGFDFLIGYDATALAFQLAHEGDLYDSCGWEYFTYRYGVPGDCGAACPSGMVRLVGIAETNNGPYHPNPVCSTNNPGWVSSVPVTLANLRFLVSNDRTLECAFVPIRFFWGDCGDNILSSHDGRETNLSLSVYEFGDLLLSRDAPFPTYYGSQDECVNNYPYPGRLLERRVDFYNGGLDIYCTGDIDATGDVNLNGIAYEIADAVMFSNYFVQGLAAFGGHVYGSIAASDTNKDGIALTIEDFVYLVRVLVGDALPYSQLTTSPNPAAFTWDTVTSVVNLSTIDTLGAVCLVVQGRVTPTLLAEQMDMKYATDGSLTRILIYSLELGKAIISGPLVSIPGATGIIEIQAATYDARAVTTSLEITGPDTTAAYSVRIGLLYRVEPGVDADVPVTLEKYDQTQGLAGFDFLMGYDASALAFQLAYEGDLYDSCAWEYFTYRFDPDSGCGNACPSGMVRLVGIAEINNGDYHPNSSCAMNNPGWVSSVPVRLANLRFVASRDRVYAWQFIPIRFFWYDCGDNALVNHNASQMYLSQNVFDFEDRLLNDSAAFPTFKGAQDWCVHSDPINGRSVIRAVDFYNGGIDIFGTDSVDAHGDINLNGLSYEIADAAMFSNYFVQGLAAFDGHADASVAQSDVNEDGKTLGIDDFVYLSRVVFGDLMPQTGHSPNSAQFTWDRQSGNVSVATVDSLGAVHLIVEGEITPTLSAGGMTMKYGSDSGLTKILIYSVQLGTAINSGPLVSISGATQIVELHAATFNARAVTAIVTDVTGVDDETNGLPVQFALHANYPNPFNPETTVQYDLPELAVVQITIFNVVGQAVRTLVDRPMAAGKHEVVWDGRDDTGRQVSSGVYIYRMSAGNFAQSRKMMLLK